VSEADEVFCLVPARGGSERIPRKNLAEVGGTSLVARAVRTAIAAFGQVHLSTDDAEIADAGRAAGAVVPSLRPSALATGDASTDAVVQHAVGEWAGGQAIVVVVQPTSPFTLPEDLVACVSALTGSTGACTAVLAVEVPRAHAFALRELADGLSRPLAPDLFDRRSQDLPRLWMPTGGAFATRTDRIRRGRPLVEPPVAAVPIPPDRALDIDEPEDLAAARAAAG
jgi:N-acylneuraminate cytidylyltransferase